MNVSAVEIEIMKSMEGEKIVIISDEKLPVIQDRGKQIAFEDGNLETCTRNAIEIENQLTLMNIHQIMV